MIRDGFSFCPDRFPKELSALATEVAPLREARFTMGKYPRITRFSEALCLLFLLAAFIAIQGLIGGTRMVFSMPSYALLGLTAFVAIPGFRGEKPAAHQICLWATALCFAYIVARACLSPVPYIARSDLYSVLAGLVVYFVTASVMTSPKQRLLFLACLLVFALVHVLIGALQFRDGTNFMPISWLQRYDYGVRASGLYVCPNHLAGLLEVLGIMGVSLVCWSRWPVWSKVLVGYVVAVCYVGLVLTGSRGGYLSTTTSLLVFAVLSLLVLRQTTTGFFWKITAPAAVAAILIGFLLVYAVGKSTGLSSRAQKTFETTNIRVDLWQAALAQWKLAPVFGTGSATYLYHGRTFRTERMQMDPIYAHNDYLQLLAEYGAFGAGLVALFVGVHLWRGVQSFRRLGPKRVAVSARLPSNALALNIGALAAVSSYVVHSALDFNLHIPANLLLLAFIFGLLANEGVRRESASASAPRSQPLWRIALPALGLILLVQCARILPGEYFAERARAAVRDGQTGRAIYNARRGLEYDAANPDLYFYLGLARVVNAESMDEPAAAASFYREATNALERARSLAPQDTPYALELADALDAQQRFDEAEGIFNDLMRLDPRAQSLQRYYQGHLDRWRGLPPPTVETPPAGS